MIATTILNGSVYGIPADLLAAHLRDARKGNRLVVWDPWVAVHENAFEQLEARRSAQ